MQKGQRSRKPFDDYDPEPERTFRARRKEQLKTKRLTMAEESEAMRALRQQLADMTTRLERQTQLEADRREADA